MNILLVSIRKPRIPIICSAKYPTCGYIGSWTFHHETKLAVQHYWKMYDKKMKVQMPINFHLLLQWWQQHQTTSLLMRLILVERYGASQDVTICRLLIKRGSKTFWSYSSTISKAMSKLLRYLFAICKLWTLDQTLKQACCVFSLVKKWSQMKGRLVVLSVLE